MALLTVVLALAAIALVSAQPENQNSWSYMLQRSNGADCASKYQSLIEDKYFANDAVCKAQVKAALETYVKANCPSTAAQSTVWKCMSGWNGTVVDAGRINDWRVFLTTCEVLYIAQRVNTAESEDGFQWRDNSCFARFNNMGAFVTYLYSGSGGGGGAATIALASGLQILLATFVALFMLR